MRAILAAIVLCASVSNCWAAPSIDWRVKHPFRFFTETRDFDMHREALADVMATNGGTLPATAVSDLERLINDPRWLREWYDTDERLYPDSTLRGRAERGWAHHINRRRATCWNTVEQWHSACDSDTFGSRQRTDYVRPQRHTAILALKEAPSGTCQWSADRAIFIAGTSLATAIAKPCSEKIEARIPFEPEKLEGERGVEVRVVLPDGTALIQPKVWVRDRLIVGIGDSFSSGEGNPDTPVEIGSARKLYSGNYNFTYDAGFGALRATVANSIPVRFDELPAGWVDRRCHRSAYSYHLRTALQVALADPKHSAVTFLGFACSGAEITEGLLQNYAGVEQVEDSYFSRAGYARRNLPQIDRVMIELCRDNILAASRRTISPSQPITDSRGRRVSSLRMLDCPPDRFLRPIDMLIVSIGGNDVGFSSLIVDVLTKSKPKHVGPYPFSNALFRSMVDLVERFLSKGHDATAAATKARALPAKFALLREAIKTLPIARAVDNRPNIVLTAFPKIEFNEEGLLCGSNERRELYEGVNVGGVFAMDAGQLAQVSGFANGDLNRRLGDAARAGNWHFVDAHRNVFTTHGICAQRVTASGISPTESLMLPYFIASSNTWKDFHPRTQTRAYAPRQRWFRTLNDSCLFVQFKYSGTPRDPSRWGPLDLLESCLGGPFHPTAEGHAHIADAVYAAAKTMLGLPKPTIEALRPLP